MAIRLPGAPEDYLSAKLARRFRAEAARHGVPPVMYLADGRYSGDEYGMTITGGGVALHMAAGLRALGHDVVKREGQ